MAGVSGSQTITHTNLLACLSGQLNNPDVSDLTLQVNNNTYHIHKLILASQSSVFRSMLTGHNWIESKEKSIKLDEHPDCIDAFLHFLKYLYSGEVTLNCDNACSLHMLADKYDIVALKEACFEFIGDVLDGVHGDLLKSATKWLPYIEKYVADLVEKCFEVIRSHFYALDRPDISLADLTVEQMKTILDPKFGNEIVVENEHHLFSLVLKWNEMKSGCSPTPMDSDILEEILPLIRFSNMNVKDLISLYSSAKYSKSYIKDLLFEASKCKDEMLHMASSKEKEIKCSCVEIDKRCKHMNPRLYFGEPYGHVREFDIDDDVDETDNNYIIPQPIDTASGTLKSYVTRVISHEENYDEDWHLQFHSVFEETRTETESETTVREVFTIDGLHESHLGRDFTLMITVMRAMKEDKPYLNRMYTIKIKGNVTTNNVGGMDEIIVYSPRRFKGEWMTEDNEYYEYLCYCAIYLN